MHRDRPGIAGRDGAGASVVRGDDRIPGRGGWRSTLADLPRDDEPGGRVEDHAGGERVT